MSQHVRPGIEDSISHLIGLSLTLQSINKLFESKYDLSVVQWSLLKVLLRMPAVSPQILAKTLGVTPGTLTQTLNRLAKKDFLFMCDDPADRRKKMISLTRAGKQALDAVSRECERIFREVNLVQTDIVHVENFLKIKVKARLGERTS